MTVAAMTKLDAVNICLSSIGETQVSSMEDSGADALAASELIDETSRLVQDKGWHWNTEVFSIAPDNNGFINLPANTSRVDSTSVDYYLDVIQRGLRLYNKDDNTYVFTDPVKVELVQTLAFEELPTSAKIFIAARAAMTFQERVIGSDSLDKTLKDQAKDAWVALVRAENETGDYNMLTDSWSVSRTLNRGMFRRGMYQ